MQVLFIGIHVLFFFFLFFLASTLHSLPTPEKVQKETGHPVTLSPQPLQTSNLGCDSSVWTPRERSLAEAAFSLDRLQPQGPQSSTSRSQSSRGEGVEEWTDILMDVAGDRSPEWTPSAARVTLSFAGDSKLPSPVTLGGKPPCFLYLKWGSWQRSRSPFGKVFCRSQRPRRTGGPRFHFV